MIKKYLSIIYRVFFPHKEIFRLKVQNTFVISLENEDKRRQKIFKTFPNLEWNWFKGINGHHLNREYLIETGQIKTPSLSKGQVGVFLSHKTLWENLVKSEDHTWLILESDILPSEKWKNKDKYLINQYILEENYDILFLGRGYRYTSARDQPIKKHLTIAAPSWQAHAYVIKKAGAEKLLRHFNGIEKPLDIWWWEIKELRILALSPDFLVQGGGPSSTQN